MRKVGLFFGSFNPIHIGHLILGNHLADNTDLAEVWFVVSPHNPHKKKANLLEDHHRLAMVRIAVEDNDRLKASDIEFDLPKPSYTVFTLQKLKEDYPGQNWFKSNHYGLASALSIDYTIKNRIIIGTSYGYNIYWTTNVEIEDKKSRRLNLNINLGYKF